MGAEPANTSGGRKGSGRAVFEALVPEGYKLSELSRRTQRKAAEKVMLSGGLSGYLFIICKKVSDEVKLR